MTIRAIRRDIAIEKMADHLLAKGLEAATLRPLAEAVGTSDRMLLYYFADRDELLSATLEHIAVRLAARLDALVPGDVRRPLAQLLAEVWPELTSDELKPYMDIWLNLSARACGGHEPYRRIAGAIADTFLAWTSERIAGRTQAAREESAQLLIAALNGMFVLHAIGRHGAANGALANLLTQAPPLPFA